MTLGDIRYWAEWAVQHIWEAPDNQNDGVARAMWAADANRIRMAAAAVRDAFPYPHLLRPAKLFYGFRHANPNLKVLKKGEWLNAKGEAAYYRSFTESWSTACNYAHDQQAVAEYLAKVRASGYTGATTDISYDQRTMEPLGLPDPWGHGYVGTVGKNFDAGAILFHWRYFYEHVPNVVAMLRDFTLNPRQPKRLAEEKEWLFYCTHFEYVVDVAMLPNVNVQSYAACTKDKFFRLKNVEDTSAYVDSLMAGIIPGPSPAFPMPRIP